MGSRYRVWRTLSTTLMALAAFLAVLGAVRPTLAAYLSELWLEPTPVREVGQAALHNVGPLIEIAGIAQPGAMEILIVDATAQSANFGRILQVIPFNAATEIHVVEHAATVTAAASPTAAGDQAVEALAFENVLGQLGRRSVLLYDGWTGLTPLDGRIQDVAERMADVTLLDIVTFGDATRTQPQGLEVVLDLALGEVFVRPMTPLLEPSPNWLGGSLDRAGRFIGDARGYPTSPGRINAVLLPGQIPEPAIGTVLTVLAAVMAGRRSTLRRRPTADSMPPPRGCETDSRLSCLVRCDPDGRGGA